MASSSASCFPCPSARATVAPFADQPGPQTPGCKRSAKLVKPELRPVQLRTLGTCLRIVQKVLLRIATRRRKYAGFLRFHLQSLQFLYQPRGNWNFTLAVVFRTETVLWLIADRHGAADQVDVIPGAVHHFLFPHSRHQEELEP